MIETGRALVTAPTEEPVSRAFAKQHLREDLDDTDQDDVIDNLIVAARDFVERRQWEALVTQTWDFWFDNFPEGGGAFQLSKPPLVSVTSIAYTDENGTTQTMDASDYQVDTSARPAVIRSAYNETWPSVRDETLKAVKVRVVVGYGNAAAVPARHKQAMLILIGDWYEHRESIVVGTISARVAGTIDALLGVDHARPMVG
jgi:uncharacterized phiE125 gp8 family phage protein